jgi:hypothetical protein
MSDIDQKKKDEPSRRKLIAGLGVFSLFPIVKLATTFKNKEVISCTPENKPKTVKFLTQDGILVEVDASKIKGDKEKISNQQLQSWVNKEL